MSTARLSRSTLAATLPRPDVTGPRIEPARTGIVHLGLGAFHRAHQAVLTEDAGAATGDDSWGILGVTQRSSRVVEQVAPQDGLYGVLTLGADEAALRVVGALREAAYPGRDTPHVLATVAAATTRIVTLTVTEKGYRRAADGTPDLSDEAVLADLAALGRDDEAPARSATGLLVRGLDRRWRADGGPLTVVCCDNLTDNGRVLAGLVDGLLAAAGADGLRAWVAEQVRFPSTMVDRIVPATTPEHHARAERLLGLQDQALVVGEPFTQWVIEDDFAGPRPAWELAGATLTKDVAPYERAKLRVLNATHSLLAYAGALRGHVTIADAVADPELYSWARALVDDDVLPTLEAPDGADLAAYRDEVLHRFANPATGHTTVQVAMDGSQKLPQRLLGTVRDRLAAGATPQAAALAVAAWMAYVRATSAGDLVVAGRQVPLDDPLSAQLADAAAGPVRGLPDRLLAVDAVFGPDLRDSDTFRSALSSALPHLA
jgi:fructuronate reductase